MCTQHVISTQEVLAVTMMMMTTMMMISPPSYLTHLASYCIPAQTLHYKESGLLTLESAFWLKCPIFQSSETQIKGHHQRTCPP